MSEAPPEAPTETSWLAPSRTRRVVAATVALGRFFIPQEVPLEWYPLNEPGLNPASDRLKGVYLVSLNGSRHFSLVHT